MALPDLESSLGKMLTAIAEKGGDNVELKRDTLQQSFQITRLNKRGIPVERFLLWSHSSLGEPMVAYELWDRKLLNFPQSVAPKILNGAKPTKADYRTLSSFVEMIRDEAKKAPGDVIRCQESYPVGRIPYFVAYFAERMILKP